MKNNHLRILLSTVPLCLLLAGCASTANEAPVRTVQLHKQAKPASAAKPSLQQSQRQTARVINYKVQPGDNLRAIANRFTGQADRWSDIAAYNNLTNANALRVGQVLKIPTQRITTSQQTKAPGKPTRTTLGSQTPSLAVRRQPAAVAPVVITPVKTASEFELSPIESNAQNQNRSFSGKGTQIKVVGSYYPKGIYTKPAYHSKLIMRVTPGATFTLVSQVNDWYRIQVENGTGYIRTNDAAIVK